MKKKYNTHIIYFLALLFVHSNQMLANFHVRENNLTPIDKIERVLPPPTANDDSYTGTEDTTLTVPADGVVANDTDPDGDNLSVVSFTISGTLYNAGETAYIAEGQLTINSDGSLTFVPAANFNGNLFLTYTASDGNGGTDSATIIITINNTNDAPVANDDNASTNQDTTLTQNAANGVLSNDTDVDTNDILTVTTYTVDGNTYNADGTSHYINGQGTITMNSDGSYTFVPDAGFTGSVSTITYTVTDDGNPALTDTADLDITVNPTSNQAPTANDDTASTPQDTTLTQTAANGVLANDTDPENDNLTVTTYIVDGNTYNADGTSHYINGQGTITMNNDGSYTFVPDAGFTGNVSTITYTINDGHGNNASANLDINVTSNNNDPTPQDDTNTTNEDATLSVSSNGVLLNDSDPDGDTLTVTGFYINGTYYSAGTTVTLPEGTFTLNADGSYTLAPAQDFNGNFPTVTYEVSDGNGGTAQADLDITVLPVNDPPHGNDDNDATNEDTTLTQNAANGVLSNDTDVDGDNLTVTQFVINGTTYQPGTTVHLAEGDFTLNADGSYTFVPTSGYFGSVPVITYTLSDGTVTDTANLFLTVIEVNNPPDAQDDTVTTNENTTLNAGAPGVLDNDSDPDGDSISVIDFVINGTTYQPGTTVHLTEGDFTLNADGSYTFVPATNYSGTVPTVTYTISDGSDTDSANLDITVIFQNDDPIAVDDSAVTPENTTLTGSAPGLMGNDSDPNNDPISIIEFTVDGQTYSAGSTAHLAEGDLTINADGSYTFVPATGYTGYVPTVTYTISDGYSTSDANFDITVDLVNIDPRITIESCNQGYTASGLYRIRYVFSFRNPSYAQTANDLQIFNDLNAIFGNGCVVHIEREWMGTATGYDNTDPEMYNGTSWDTVEFNESDPTPGQQGILNSSTVANNSLYPGQAIWGAYCIDIDPNCAGGAGVGSGNGVSFDNVISGQASTGNGTNHLEITDFHTYGTTVAAGIYVPNPQPIANSNGTYDFDLQVTITNDGSQTANNVQFYLPLIEFINNSIPINSSAVTQLSGPSVALNAGYDPSSVGNTGILDNNVSLTAGQTIILNVHYNVGPTNFTGTCNFPYPNPSITEGPADQIIGSSSTENPNHDTYVTWSDSQGNQLDKYYELQNVGDLPSSETQCNCSTIHISFDFDITLHINKTIINDIPSTIHPDQSGNREITFQIEISNDTNSDVQVENLHLVDDLGNICSTANILGITQAPNITYSTANTNPNLNIGYDGINDTNIFDNNSGILLPGESLTIEYTVEINDPCFGINYATFYASDPSGHGTRHVNSGVEVEVWPDFDNDTLADNVDLDDDNDGILDETEACLGLNGKYYGTNYWVYSILSAVRHTYGNPDASFITTHSNFANGSGGLGNGTHLQDFLGSDAASLDTDPTNRRRGIIKLTGYVYLEAGNHNFRVRSDDGYRIRIDWNSVAEVDHNQGATTRVHDVFTVPETRYYPIEILYWDAGGGYTFTVEMRYGNQSYEYLDTTNTRRDCDIDLDGLPNNTDLDADSDGISDIIEAGGTDTDNDGQVDYPTPGNPRTMNDADLDGWDDSLDFSQGGTPYNIPDTDGDGIPNFKDIDSDGDGIVDIIEAQTTSGYQAPAGVDTDGDGLDDHFDQDEFDDITIGNGTGTAIDPVDTDNDIIPDYLDDNSDDDSDPDALEGWDTNNDGTPNTTPSGNDDDNDGLDDAYDNNDVLLDPTNGQTPNDFPNLDITNPDNDRDWREKYPHLTITKDDNLSYLPQNLNVGDVIYYDIEVTNTGTVPLSNITVTDSNSDVTFTSSNTITNLDVGDSVIITAEHIVTLADINAGIYTNSASASCTYEIWNPDDVSDDTDPDSPTGDDDPTITHIDQNAELTVYKDDNLPYSAQSLDVGDVITYNMYVKNTGNVTLYNINFSDNNANITSGTNPIVVLDPGNSVQFIATHTVTQADLDAGFISNQAQATTTFNGNSISDLSDDTDINSPGGDDDPTITNLIQNPLLVVTKDDQLDYNSHDMVVGDAIDYIIEVTNAGNITFSQVTLTDANANIQGSNIVNSFGPGQTFTFHATHTITQADIDAGVVSNSAIADGIFDGTTYSDTSDDTDPSSPGGTNDPTLTFITQNPGMYLTKDDALSYNSQLLNVGDVITYYIKVHNTGNVTLTNINITDNNATFPSGSVIASVPPNSTGSILAHHVVTQADIDAGFISNSATASTDFNGVNYADVSDDLDPSAPAGPDDPTITHIQQNPSIEVIKDDNLAYIALPFNVGDVINYDIYVTNTGNVTLINIGVNDPNATNLQGAPIASLAPGQTAHLTANHTITQDDIDAGKVLNSAIATTQFDNTPYDDVSDDSDPNSPPADDDPTTTFIEQNPSLVVTKDDGYPYTPQNLHVGDIITYIISVTNTGNVRLADIDIIDNNATLSQTNIPSLDIGQTITLNATHTVTQDDINNGVISNSATASTTFNNNTISDVSDDTDTASPNGDNDPTLTYIVQTPEITLTKDDNFDFVAQDMNVGDVINYTIIVTNTGNVTFNQLVITDNNASITSGNPVLNLLPGNSATIQAEHIVTQADIDAGQVINSADVSGTFNNVTYTDISDDTDPGSQVGDNDPTITFLAQHPELTVTKDDGLNYNPHLLALGSSITYNITVKNTGNVTLTNVSLTDANATISGSSVINSLAPGQTASFVATHTISQTDLDSGQVSNQATAATVFDNASVSDDSDDLDPLSPAGNDDPTLTFLQKVPAIELTKDDGLPRTVNQNMAVGDLIYYQITVTNTGNVTLSQIDVTDANAQIQGSTSVNNLAPQSSEIIQAQHVITQADLDAGFVSNSATGTTVYEGSTYTDISDDTDPAAPSGNDDPTLTFLTQSPSIVVFKDDNLPMNAQLMNVGDVIQYTISVTNTGNVALTNINITDANATFPAGNTITSLDVGQTQSITAEHTITQLDLNNGYVSNSATATTIFNNINVTDISDDADVASPPGDDDPTITLLTQNPGITVTKDDQLPYIPQNLGVGDVIHYQINVINTGNVTFPQVSISDANANIVAGTPILNLAPGATAIVQANHTITQADIDSGVVSNSAIVSAQFNNTNYSDTSDDTDPSSPAGENDDTLTFLTQTPSMLVKKDDGYSYTPQILSLGDVINYTISVTNTGNVTLTNVTLTDANASFTGNNIIATIAPGQTVNVNAQHTITQADIDAGQVINSAVASVDFNGTILNIQSDDADPSSPANPDDDTITFIQQQPQVEVMKDDQFTFSPQNLDVGDLITYQITVYNTGNVTLNNINVTDANAQFVGGNTIATLAPQTSATLIAQHAVTQAELDAGVVSNQAIASFDLNGTTYQDLSDDTDPASLPGNDDPTLTYLIQTPDLIVTKDDGLTYTAQQLNVGDIINYDIIVTNTGNVTLTNISLNDNNATFTNTNIIAQLDVNQSITLQATHQVTQADIDAGQVVNSATANTLFGSTQLTDVSDDADIASPSGNDDPTITFIEQTPELVVTKDDQLPYVPQNMNVGDVIDYRIYVHNAGNVTLTNINVTDANAQITNGNLITSIAPGDTQTLIAQHIITQADLDSGQVSNSAVATTQFNSTTYSDMSDDTDTNSPVGDNDPTITLLVQSPSLSVTKDDGYSYTPQSLQVGDIINYTIAVTNTGNVTLSSISVTDANATFTGNNIITSINPGQTVTVNAQHTVTQADLDAGQIVNSATGTVDFNGTILSEQSDDADPNSPANPHDDTITFIEQLPSVEVTKDDQLPFTPQNLDVGNVITYQVSVYNSGNVTLTNITLTDANAQFVGGSNTISTLDPQATSTFIVQHTITQADLDAGVVSNQAIADFDFNGINYQDLSDDTDPSSLPGNDDPTLTHLVQTPSLIVTKDDGMDYSAHPFDVGDVITYDITVTNTGNVTLNNISLADQNANFVTTNIITQLDVNQSITLQATHVITQTDIDAGQVSNSAVASTLFGSVSVSDISDDTDVAAPSGDDDPTITHITQTPSMEVTKDDQLAYTPQNMQLGDIITYRIFVHNTGNVTLTNISILDNNAIIPNGNPITSIAPGATQVVIAQHAIVQADLDAGVVSNSATASTTFNNVIYQDVSDDTDTASPTPGQGDDPTLTFLEQHPSIVLTKDDQLPYNPQNMSVGDVITYLITATNTGDVTLNVLTITDNNASFTGANTIVSLSPGQSETLTATHTITQADMDAGEIHNSATISTTFNGNTVSDISDDTDPFSPGGNDDETITFLIQNPGVTLYKNDQLPYSAQNLHVGDVIHYQIIVENTGNITLANIDVTDANATIISGNPVTNLAPGQQAVVLADHTVTQADINNTEIVNQAVGTFTYHTQQYQDLSDDLDPLSPNGHDDPTITSIVAHPGIEVTKDDGINGSCIIPQNLSVGDVVTYTVVVTNTGNITLTDVTLQDDNAVPHITQIPILEINTSETITLTHIVTQDDIDAGQIINSATAYTVFASQNITDVSDDIDPDSQTPGVGDDPTITKIVQAPGIEITKDDQLPYTPQLLTVGTTIDYLLTVTNTGNVTLPLVNVMDANAIILSGTPITDLAPQTSVTIHAHHIITQADIDTGQYINQANVEATFNGTLYSDLSDDTDIDSTTPGIGDDPTVTTFVQNPELTVTKDDHLPYSVQNLNVGYVINYTIAVTNSGNVTLNNVVINDANATISGSQIIPQILPGQTTYIQATHPVTQADIDAGEIVNSAVANSVFNNLDVTDISDDTDQLSPAGNDDPTITHLEQHVDFVVTKDDGLPYLPQNLVVGDMITYQIVITNTGNVSLVSVDVTDGNASIITPVPISNIPPGASAVVQAVHYVTQADIDNERVVNQATATVIKNGVTYTDLSDDADISSPVGDDDPTITFLVKQYDFQLKKHGVIIAVDPNKPMPGEKIQYIFEVYNTGRQTISNVVITDPMLPNITYQSGDVDGDNQLDIDEIWVYYADLILTQSMIDAGFVDNRALVVGMTPSGTIISDVSDDPNNPTDIDIEGDGEGDDITHTIIPQVKEIQLLKTGVFNDENGDGLADEGETITYTFTVINTGNVTMSDIQIHDPIVNVVGGAFNLGAGESNSTNFTATYFITLADIERGYVVNSAQVTAKDPIGYQFEDISDDPNDTTDVDTEGDNEPDDPTIVKTANIKAYEILTPNDDGLNDFFHIIGIESFPNNQVRIYNRWGNLVFTAYSYNNTDNYWNGGNMYNNNKELPVGVYYYVIDLGDENIDKIFTGSIYLNK